MINRNHQSLTPSSQQKLTKYSSDLIKKSLSLAQKINKNLQKKFFWASVFLLGEDLEYVASVSVSSGGKRLASYHYTYKNPTNYVTDKLTIIWDLDTRKKMKVLEGGMPIQISQDGKLLAYIKWNKLGNQAELIIYQIDNETIVKKIIIGENILGYYPKISPLINKMAWLDSESNNVVIYDLEEYKIIHSFPYKPNKEGYNDDDEFDISFSPNGDFLSVSSAKINDYYLPQYSDAYIFDVNSGQLLKIIDLLSIKCQAPAIIDSDGVIIIAFMEGETNVSMEDYHCSSLLFDIKTNKVLSFVDSNKYHFPVYSYCLSLDAKTIVKGSFEGIEVLKAFTLQEVLDNEYIKNKVVKDLLYLGDFHFKNGDYRESKQTYADLLHIEPSNETALQLMSILS